MSDLCKIVIVGDVSHGKSSVVATLVENDKVDIGPLPTTVNYETFRVGDLLEFVDTPGFQNARQALLELKAAASDQNPLEVFSKFVAQHEGGRFFVNECRLLEPLLDGASLLYIVDIARPMEAKHEAEIEILRLTGAPRIALLNQTGAPQHRAAWEARLRQNFSAVIEFNAHSSSFCERIALLEALAAVDLPGRTKIREAIPALKRNREEKLDEVARVVIDAEENLLTLKQTEGLRVPAQIASQTSDIQESFKAKISKCETAMHRELIRIFTHNKVTVSEGPSIDLFEDGLFVEKNWSLLGLNTRQMVAAGALTGAGGGMIAGVKIDLFSVGATGGIATAAGGVMGFAMGGAMAGITAFFGRRSASRITVKIPYFSRAIAGTELTVGPINDQKFPWIVLDRAIGVFLSVSKRSHARREKELLNPNELRERLRNEKASADQAPDPVRKALSKAFSSIRNGRFDHDKREAAVTALREWLKIISTHDPATR